MKTMERYCLNRIRNLSTALLLLVFNSRPFREVSVDAETAAQMIRWTLAHWPTGLPAASLSALSMLVH